MIENLFKNIFDLGIGKDTSTSLRARIRLTNQINFGLLLFAIIFTVSFILKDDPTSKFSIIAIALVIVLILLNAWGFHVAARVLTSTLPVFITTLTHAMKVPEGMPPIAGNYLLTASLMVLPYIVFDPRERIRIGITSVINISFFLSLPLLSPYFSSDVVYEEVRKLDNQVLYFFISSFILIGSLYILIQSNRLEIKRSRDFLNSMKASKEDAEKTHQELERSLQELEKAKEEDRNRNWITEGISQFGEMMRLHSEDDDFYDRLISDLVKLIDLNQAAIFLLHTPKDEEAHLKMVACFAYNRKKYLDKKILIGEGLTGQVVRDRDKIFLTDVPAEYMSIKSGLGASKPNCVLIVPLIINDNVEGVLEMASFHVIEPHQIEFLERLAENIASIVNSKRLNLQTRKLLESSQETTEVLKRQEEEMRENMEELFANQEQQKRKEKELNERIKELEQLLDAQKIEKTQERE